ncbi:ribonuclease III [bacterium]|nr:ribonuclease III [bacterium]
MYTNEADLLDAAQEILEYQFQDRAILLAALTHASGANSRVVSNERLEFLGDSVLGLVICEQLYRLYPSLLEGELTKIKSVVVSRRTCARISRAMGLDRFLILGRGMTTQAVVPASVMAAVFESLIGALFLDGGFKAAKTFILAQTQSEIERSSSGHHGGNYKSLLQQMSQKQFGAIPVYETLSEVGPDHSKSFRVAAVVGTHQYSPAWGRNKKEAEQRAALNAISQLSGLEIPYPESEEV